MSNGAGFRNAMKIPCDFTKAAHIATHEILTKLISDEDSDISHLDGLCRDSMLLEDLVEP